MSSPQPSSPPQEDHAKRKRDEKDAAEKHVEDTTSAEVHVAPKKLKPDGTQVTKAEVKQIQRNLKTMPLDDKGPLSPGGDKEMDDVESDAGSAVDSPRVDTGSPAVTATSAPDKDIGKAECHSQQEEEYDEAEKAGHEAGNGTKPTVSITLADDKVPDTPSSSASTSTPTTSSTTPAASNSETSLTSAAASSTPAKSSGFGAFSGAASPFGNVTPGANVFGSKSSTMGGFGGASTASPFATAAASGTNVFGEGGGGTSVFGGGSGSSSVFGGTASTTSAFGAATGNVFGGPAATSKVNDTKGAAPSSSVFGSSSMTSGGFGASSSTSSPFGAASGNIFGGGSTVSSNGSTGASPLNGTASVSVFGSSSSTNAPSTFSTFGAKYTDSQDTGFGRDTEANKDDFGSLLAAKEENEDGDDNEEVQNEEEDVQFGTGIFTKAEQVAVPTGEEDERTLFQTKGKLFVDSDHNHAWKERGKGTFKIQALNSDENKARLVMRADGILRLILNVNIFAAMNPIITGEKYVRLVGIEEGKLATFLLKVRDAPTAQEILETINITIKRQAGESVNKAVRWLP